MSPASSSPTLTALGRDGKTNGVFFRTITSDALQGTAAAKYALDQGLKKIAVIHVNNDFGVNIVREFSAAYTKLGGTITSTTPYNEQQASYPPRPARPWPGSRRRCTWSAPRSTAPPLPAPDLGRRPAEAAAQ